MMEAFTVPFTGINPTAAAMTSGTSPTTTPASVPNESAGFTATITSPLSSPKQHCSPSTPNSTPLRQRFLRAVTMSPAIPSRTPTEGQKSSEKARESPVVVRHTPKKTNQPPMKLEVGQGAFYFSIELPPSKVTPKKGGTTSKSGTPKGGDTPTRARTSSPLKNASPTKENATGTPTRTTRSPLKHRETAQHSPARALFGTPTRTMTPKQDTGPQSPTRKTLSPRKNHSSVKQSHARIAVSSPKRQTLADTPGSNRPGSLVKRSIEQDNSLTYPTKASSLSAKKLRPESKKPPRKPIIDLVNLKDEHTPNANLVATTITNPTGTPHPDSTGQAPTVKACPENIGQLMASLISNTTSTHDWALSRSNDMISPVPTPLRKAGEKLKLGESPSFLRMSDSGTTAITHEDLTADITKIGSLTPHEAASTASRQEESKPIEPVSSGPLEEAVSSSITTDQMINLDHSENVPKVPRPAHSLHAASLAFFNTLNMTRIVPAPPHRPLLFPKQRSEIQQKGTRQQENHVSSQELHKGQPDSPQPLPASQQRRAGTDPSVLLKMQKDMVNLEATMRRSAGVIDPAFCGPLNLNELPAMPNRFFVREHQNIRSPDVLDTPHSLSRAKSDNSSLGAMQKNGRRGTENAVAPSRVSSTPRIPQWKPSGPTPAQVKGDRLSVVRQKDSHSTGADRTTALGRSRPRVESAVSGPGKSNVVTSMSRRKTPAAPVKQTVPAETISHISTPSRIPSVSSTKAKTSTPSVPQNARKPLPSISDKGKAVAALKERLPNIPSVPINTRPVAIRKPSGPSTTKLYNLSADPRPQKFASAGDIADRLAKWHDEDRKKVYTDRPTVTAKTTTNTPAKTPVKSQPDESTTPDGSPNKILTPPTASAATKPPKPLAPTKNVKPIPLSTKPTIPSTPKFKPRAPAPVPKTPAHGPRQTAINNLRQPITADAKTPVNRRISVLDRNATRTPSKAIVSSLDRAIDRKIAEDARRGLEFTPGGIRLKDLLDAQSGESEK